MCNNTRHRARQQSDPSPNDFTRGKLVFCRGFPTRVRHYDGACPRTKRKQEGRGAFLARCVRCPDCTVSLGWNRHSTGPKTLIYGEALGPHSSDRGPTLSACLIRYRGMVSIIARLAPCNRVPFST
ncbi:hypothetical protein CCHR01_02799 [Colletotrichum chrysophilum]|uniref:Uncharacterized protein n=1 Tax=Colletotrichum chrysophilum TaxID=1836956 RepID=A0AAD9EN88_9PEZI|nr:hypothetical protein CCHR01_02799 [Colletotrichum chrysophilum]